MTCNSANKSDGLDEWKAPDAMKRMKSVFTFPCLVVMHDPMKYVKRDVVLLINSS